MVAMPKPHRVAKQHGLSRCVHRVAGEDSAADLGLGRDWDRSRVESAVSYHDLHRTELQNLIR